MEALTLAEVRSGVALPLTLSPHPLPPAISNPLPSLTPTIPDPCRTATAYPLPHHHHQHTPFPTTTTSQSLRRTVFGT